MTFLLRGFGPRVFISYSFQDAPLAAIIDQTLAQRGFQVRREDETSLSNYRLTEAIPQRIAKAEVLIQILTATANNSEWVAREFAYAIEQREVHHRPIVILPVVFDKASLPSPVKEWWFLEVGSGGLTEQVLDHIERICLRSVHLLPLASEDPLAFREAETAKLLRELPDDGKRVIVDSDGCLLRWAQDTLDYIDKMDSPYRDQFMAQERERMRSLISHYQVIDEVVRKLVIEIMREVRTYTLPRRQLPAALLPLQRYAMIVIGDDVVTAAQVAPPAPHPLRSELRDRVDAASEANTSNYSRGFCNPGFYAWVFGEEGGEDTVAQMDMSAPGFRSIRVIMPKQVFGSMAAIYTNTPIPFDPRGELLQGTFINYVLPQIAVDASYNLVDPATAGKDLYTEYAWRLDQYDRMGLS